MMEDICQVACPISQYHYFSTVEDYSSFKFPNAQSVAAFHVNL